MKSISFKTIFLASALTLMTLNACSSNSSGGGSSPAPVAPLLTADQARFDATSNAIAQSNQWNQASSHPSQHFAQTAAVNSAAAGKAVLEQKVAQNCTIVTVVPGSVNTPSQSPGQNPSEPNQIPAIQFSMKVNGPNCPISLDMNSSMVIHQTANGAADMNIDFGILYQSVSDEAKASMEVQEYKIKLTMAANQTSMTGSGDGYVVTKTDGRVAMTFAATGSGNQQSSTMTWILNLVYPDGLRVELKKVDTNSSAGPQEAYFINNLAVDKKTFNRYVAKILPNFNDGSSKNSDQSESSSDHTGGGSVGSYSDSYQFNDNGCDTGKQMFSTDSESSLRELVCAGLQNETLNHSCAQNERRQYFQTKCPGRVFQPTLN